MQKAAGTALPVLAAVFVSALTVSVLLLLPPNVWQSWRPAPCFPETCFCEAVNSEGPVRQTANTVSSLGFVFSGVLMMAATYYPSNLGRLPAGYSVLMGVASVVIGVGSAFYHASLTFMGQFFDVFGMFLLAAFILVYAWERIYKFESRTTLMLYLLLNAGLTWLQIAVPETRRFLFAIVLVVALLFENSYRVRLKPQIAGRWLWTAAGLMAGAYIIWVLDNFHIVCSETSILQGHAIWHLLGAISVMCLHGYYVSEGRPRDPKALEVPPSHPS